MILHDPKTREQWLQYRTNGIGGSDAACILGLNPWKSNVQLWREKCRIDRRQDISDNPAVKFGKEAEAPIREIYMLMHPELTCEYHEFRMYANDRRPFIYATLDGELTDSENRRGILEIKTTTIQQPRQWQDWKDRIPQHYYVQILHQMLSCEWAEFVTVNAFIRYGEGGALAKMQAQTIWREDVREDLDMLWDAEARFWEQVQKREEPALILPEI